MALSREGALKAGKDWIIVDRPPAQGKNKLVEPSLLSQPPHTPRPYANACGDAWVRSSQTRPTAIQPFSAPRLAPNPHLLARFQPHAVYLRYQLACFPKGERNLLAAGVFLRMFSITQGLAAPRVGLRARSTISTRGTRKAGWLWNGKPLQASRPYVLCPYRAVRRCRLPARDMRAECVR